MEYLFPNGVKAIAENYADAMKHLRTHHPDLYEQATAAGTVPTTSDPQEQAKIEAQLLDEKIQARFLKILIVYLFELENWKRSASAYLFDAEKRLRVIEGKPAVTEQQFNTALSGLDQITKEQFMAAIKARLGL